MIWELSELFMKIIIRFTSGEKFFLLLKYFRNYLLYIEIII